MIAQQAGRPNPVHVLDLEVRGPWSLGTSRTFWEGFAPSALQRQHRAGELRTAFLSEADWTPVEATVVQLQSVARVSVTGPGDLDAAVRQVGRFLSLDIDARAWPDVGERDPVIGRVQRLFPGLRPCGFHSPYEAAAWAVLSQRVQMRQAARLKQELVDRHGEAGAFPGPNVLRGLELDLPGRKQEYLHAVAEAALDGVLDGAALRAQETASALQQVRGITGLGPFAAELVLIRGANAPDLVPRHEKRLGAEVAEQYGAARTLSEVADGWRPFRAWASVHLRVLREFRAQDPDGPLR